MKLVEYIIEDHFETFEYIPTSTNGSEAETCKVDTVNTVCRSCNIDGNELANSISVKLKKDNIICRYIFIYL